MDLLNKSGTICISKIAVACDSMVLGSLLKICSQHGLRPIPGPLYEGDSATDLISKFSKIEVLSYFSEIHRGYSGYPACFYKSLKAEICSAARQIETELVDPDPKSFELRARKSRA